MAEAAPHAPTILVTGTDTGVGKTWVSVGLLRALGRAGVRARGLKPVASGADATPDGLRNEDALALMAAASAPALPYAAINPCCYAPPIAPHLAAEAAGQPVDPAVLAAAIAHARRDCDLLLIEGAGGWRVPLAAGYGFPELARDAGADVLLVVGLRLGCINHALLSAEAIRRDGLRLIGWVGNPIEPGMLALVGNLSTLEALLPAPCLGILPTGPDDAAFDAVATTFLPPPRNPGMSATIDIEVAYARPDRQWLIALTLPAGATVLDAVMQSGLPDQIPDLPALAGNVGIHGLPCPPTQPLADGDRVEIYRPLTIDPKDARRARAVKGRK